MRDTFERAAGDHFAPDDSLHRPEAVFFEASKVDEPAADASEAASATVSGDAVVSTGPSGKGVTEDTTPLKWAESGWLLENPLGVPTERELHTLERGLPVYRVMLVKR